MVKLTMVQCLPTERSSLQFISTILVSWNTHDCQLTLNIMPVPIRQWNLALLQPATSPVYAGGAARRCIAAAFENWLPWRWIMTKSRTVNDCVVLLERTLTSKLCINHRSYRRTYTYFYLLGQFSERLNEWNTYCNLITTFDKQNAREFYHDFG